MHSTSHRRILCLVLFLAALLSACSAAAAPAPDPSPTVSADETAPGQAVGPESAPPSEFRIGNAVAPINYYMTAWMLNDLFKMAGFEAEIGSTAPSQAWIPILDGRWEIARRFDVPTDDLGWATSLALEGGDTAQRLSALVFANERENVFPAGTYRVLWEGAGVLAVEGPSEVTRVGPGEMTFAYDGSGEVIVSILKTDPEGTGDYIRNIRVLRPDAVPGERFNRQYLEEIRPYAVIRPLHFFGEQLIYGPPIPWEDRKPENYSHWGGALGAPYEVGIDLANQSESDLWLNVPVAASDDFMRNLAELAASRLDGNRRLYIELGNELWNWADPYAIGRQYALDQARARWPGVEGAIRPYSDGEAVSEAMLIYSWQGARTAEMGAIFKKAFGEEAHRVVVVLAGQVGASQPGWAPSRYLLESPVWVGEEGAAPAADHAAAFAIAPYIGEEEGVISFCRESAAAFIADAMAYTRGEAPWGEDAPEPGLRYLIRSDRALAAEFGLPLIAYEGGQHFTGSRFTRDEVNVHPDMYALYQAYFDVWEGEGGGLFVHLAGIIPRGVNEPGTEPGYFESENFGIKELQTQTEAEAPKWRALRDRMRALGQF